MKNQQLAIWALGLIIAVSGVFGISQAVQLARNSFSDIPTKALTAQVSGPGSGLVAHWTFDEASGTTAGDSAGSNTGTLKNGPTRVIGRVGGALSFDGVDDSVVVNTTLVGSNDLSICSWFLAKSSPPDRFSNLFNNVKLYISVDSFTPGAFLIRSSNNGATDAQSAPFDPDAWHHLCVARSGSNVTFYIDGQVSGNANQPAGAPSVSAWPFTIAQSASATDNNFLGSIDDVRIYNRTLSAADVTQIYTDVLSNPDNDKLVPIFTNVRSTVSPTSATITWTTDEVSDSQVAYSTDTSYGTLSAVNSNMTKNHTVTLSSLPSQTTFNYRVRSKDLAGNQGIDTTNRTFTTGAPAGTVTDAASCSYNDVKTAIENAADEGVVRIPPGTCIWDQMMVVDLQSSPKSLTIKGRDNCTLDTDGRPTSCPTVIQKKILNSNSWNSFLFHFKLSKGESFRFSNLAITTDPSVVGNALQGDVIHPDGASDALRIDHIYFNHNGGRAILPTGDISGVIDHNYFGPQTGFAVHPWGEGLGNESWAQPVDLGGSHALFIEDNLLLGAIVTDSHRGGRFVIRHNEIKTVGTPAQNHGTESGGGVRGGVTMEVYNNVIDNSHPLYASQYAGFVRSGTGVFHNNIITGPQVTVVASLLNYRAFDSVPPFGSCDGTGPYDVNDGVVYDTGTYTGTGIIENGVAGIPAVLTTTRSQPWVNNQWVGYSLRNVTRNWGSEIVSNTGTTVTPVPSGVSGYPPGYFANPVIEHEWRYGDQYQILRVVSCMDMPGTGQTDLLSNYEAGKLVTPVGPPHQKSEPLYAWNNTINGVSNNKFSTDSTILRKNRDYFEGVCRPGYTPYTYPHPLVQQQDNVSSQSFPLNCPGAIPSSNLTVTKVGTGTGSISGGNLSCSGSTCSATVNNGTSVTLTAVALSGSTFTGWSGGGCSGTAACTVTVNSNTSITATFTLNTASAPTISNPLASNVTSTGATLTWTTNQPTNTQVAYGVSSSYGSQTPKTDLALVTSHSVSLTSLTPNTTYYYQLRSENSAGTLVTSTGQFSTAAGQQVSTTFTPGTRIRVTATGVNVRSVPTTQNNTPLGTHTLNDLGTINTNTQNGTYSDGYYWWNVNFDTSPSGWVTESNITQTTVTPTYSNLTVDKNGQGTITGTGISCGTDCNEQTLSGTSITLTATPATGYTFSAWASCTSVNGSTCTIINTGNPTVYASFTDTTPNNPPVLASITTNATDVDTTTAGIQIYPNTTVTYSSSATDADGEPLAWAWFYKINGGAEVLHANGNCASTCVIPNASYAYTTTGTYTWIIRASDGLAVREHTLNVTVIPRPAIYSLSTTVVGSGTITCNGTTCPASAQDGTVLTLVANPSANYTFTTWGGACTGAGSCTLTMNGNKAVSATFIQNQVNDTTAPVISNAILKRLSNKAVQITWVTNEPAYSQVEYGTDTSYGSKTPLSTTLSATHLATISNLVRGRIYHYRLISRDAAGNTRTTEDFSFEAPPKPSAVTIIIAESGSVKLSWSRPAHIDYTQIQIYRGTQALTTPTGTPLVTLTDPTITTYTDSTAEPSTTYVYTIFTKDADGTYSDPKVITFTTDPAPPVTSVPGAEDLRQGTSIWSKVWNWIVGIFS